MNNNLKNNFNFTNKRGHTLTLLSFFKLLILLPVSPNHHFFIRGSMAIRIIKLLFRVLLITIGSGATLILRLDLLSFFFIQPMNYDKFVLTYIMLICASTFSIFIFLRVIKFFLFLRENLQQIKQKISNNTTSNKLKWGFFLRLILLAIFH
jgi:hypothetical protein